MCAPWPEIIIAALVGANVAAFICNVMLAIHLERKRP